MTREWRQVPGEPSPEQLAAFADGRLAGAEQALVERWLAAHPETGVEIDVWRRLGKAWRQTTAPEPAPAAWERTLSRIEAAVPVAARQLPPGPRPWRGWLALGSAAVLAGLLLFGRAFWGDRSLGPPELGEEGPLPVAGTQDVTIISMDACDTDALVIGQPPVPGDINIAEHGDVKILDPRNMEIRLKDWAAPMIVDPLVLATEPKEDD